LKTVTAECRLCGRTYELKVNPGDFMDWRKGKHIQDAMPYLSAGDRELLISGTCESCFDELFG
jgi:hypothetical protein